MWNRALSGPLLFPLLMLGVLISVGLGFLAQSRFLLPCLNVLLCYPFLFGLLARDRRPRAFASMIFWAVCLGIVTVAASVHFPERAGNAIFHGPAYARDMFHWIRTGEGAEGNPMLFVPQHLLHFVIFCLLSAVSASLLSLLMGALLMNYMSFYVASLILASNDRLTAVLMGWHPWSIIRIFSYVLLGVILGEPLVCKLAGRDYDSSRVRPFLWIALSGLAVDILMKALLAPWWGQRLHQLIG
jgi:hypothetical protein